MNSKTGRGTGRYLLYTVIGLGVLSASAAIAEETPLYSEDFVGMSDGMVITTGNTSLTILKTISGTQGSVYEVDIPSPLDSGPAARIVTSTTNTANGSQNVQTAGFTGTTALNVGTLAFSVYTPAAFVALNSLTITTGSGSHFVPSNQGIYSPTMATQAAFALRISDSGALQVNLSSTEFTNLGAFTFDTSTAYDLVINFNTSGSSVSYGGGAMASNTGDLRINGVLVADDFAMRNAGRVSSVFTLRFAGGLNNTQAYYLDDLAVYNSALVPEPSTLALGALSLVVAAYAARRSRTTSIHPCKAASLNTHGSPASSGS